MKHTTIGHVPAYDGTDWYYLIELEESDVDLIKTPMEVAGSLLSQQTYRECHAPGGVYCTTVCVTPYPYSETKFIGIAEVRYDV